MKVLLTLLVVAASTSFIAALKEPSYKKNFHDVHGNADVIDSIEQVNCSGIKLCDGYDDQDYCWRNCEKKLVLDLDDFSTIASNAFRSSNFSQISLKSESDVCSRKWLTLTPESFHGVSLDHLELDCVNLNSTSEPFKALQPLKELSLSRIVLRELPDNFFSNFLNLTGLKLSKIRIPVVTSSFFSQINKDLVQILLINNGLKTIEGKSFEKFSNLEDLNLSNNQLTSLHRDAFYGLNKLVFLNLNNNDITMLGPNAFGTLPRLAHLLLTSNRINVIETETFSGLPLQFLTLKFNELTAFSFRNMTDLKTLELSYNRIPFLSPYMLEGLKNNDLELNLENNQIQYIEPDTFQGCNFYTLNLKHNNLNVLGNGTFNGLHIQKWLDLRYNNIDEIKTNAYANSTVEGFIYLRDYAMVEIEDDIENGSHLVDE